MDPAEQPGVKLPIGLLFLTQTVDHTVVESALDFTIRKIIMLFRYLERGNYSWLFFVLLTRQSYTFNT